MPGRIKVVIIMIIMACCGIANPGPAQDKSAAGRNLALAEDYRCISIPLDHYRSEWLLVNSLVFSISHQDLGDALFNDITLYASDSDRTYYIASNLDDPRFENFSDLLTDGLDQTLVFRFENDSGGFGVQTDMESHWLADIKDGNKIDLGGFEIKYLALEVTDLTFSSYYGPFGMFFTDIFFEGKLIVCYE